MTAVYYLQWHNEQSKFIKEAANFFHAFHNEIPTKITKPAFNRIYQKVAEVETADLNQLFLEWNPATGQGSLQFRQLLRCNRCNTYLEEEHRALHHAIETHEEEHLQQTDNRLYFSSIRGLNVGDIVELPDKFFVCIPRGWMEIEFINGGAM